ncbi:MAG: amidohydrolase family protein [Thermoplasmata archaeon]|nr:amidohydrolase family protein [Thermoplasmata archaeon]
MPVRSRHHRPLAERPPPPSQVLIGRTLQHGKIRAVEVGLGESGEIVAVGRSISGGRRHDLGEAVLLPAAVDLHVHFRSPDARVEGENWSSGTIQAALGGVGTVGEMPNANPAVSTASRLVERAERGRGRLAVDMVLFGALVRARDVAALGRVAGALKLYLAPTTGIDDPVDQDEAGELLRSAASTGLAVTVHAEDPAHFRPLGNATNPVEWDSARPLEAEEAAVERLLRNVPPSLRLHIAHVTSARVSERLRAAGHSFEVSPHHLLLHGRPSDGARFKVNPPLRSETERARLWEELTLGRVPCVASDHAPHDPEEKEGPFSLAPAGVPGVGTLLPLLLARARRGELSLSVLVQAACERPSLWFGVPGGRLLPGHRGGVIAVDFRRIERFHASRFPSSCGWSPFEGSEMIFPVEHWRGGERIVEGGEYTGRPTGSIVRPEYARN